jgi:hypothetical protein
MAGKSNTERSHSRRDILRAHGISVKAKGRIEDLIRGRNRAVAPSVAPRAVAPSVAPRAVAPSVAPRAVAGTSSAVSGKTGAKGGVWGGPVGQLVVRAVTAGLKAKGQGRSDRKAVRNVIAEIRPRLPFNQWSEEALRKGYYRARQYHGDSPPPPLPPGAAPAEFRNELSLLQKWGTLARPSLGAEEARELLVGLYTAAGSHRPVGRMIEMISKRYGIVDHEKIEWLRVQERKLAADRQYYPRARPEIVNRTNLELVVKVVRQAPDHKANIAYIMRKSRKSRDSVVNLTRRLCGEGELVRTAPGTFTLPELGAAHVPAHKQVLAVFEANPNTEYKAVDLAKILGRRRMAIDSALHGHGALAANGNILCVRRGVFRLARPR